LNHEDREVHEEDNVYLYYEEKNYLAAEDALRESSRSGEQVSSRKRKKETKS